VYFQRVLKSICEHGEREGKAGYPLAGGALPVEGGDVSPSNSKSVLSLRSNRHLRDCLIGFYLQ
jgi:hypothetical protein